MFQISAITRNYSPLPVDQRYLVSDWATAAGRKSLQQATDYQRRAVRRPLVLLPGCFDTPHPGHVALLDWAAHQIFDDKDLPHADPQHGFIIVALNRDESVRRLKGRGRPLLPFEQRAYVLLGLRAVHLVVGFGEDTATSLVEFLRPDFVVKGARAGADLGVIPEWRATTTYRGQVIFVPLAFAALSTTKLRAKRKRLRQSKRKHLQ